MSNWPWESSRLRYGKIAVKTMRYRLSPSLCVVLICFDNQEGAGHGSKGLKAKVLFKLRSCRS